MKDCMTTFTGLQFNAFEPEADKIRIEDIAHALSMMVRANGHFPPSCAGTVGSGFTGFTVSGFCTSGLGTEAFASFLGASSPPLRAKKAPPPPSTTTAAPMMTHFPMPLSATITC